MDGGFLLLPFSFYPLGRSFSVEHLIEIFIFCHLTEESGAAGFFEKKISFSVGFGTEAFQLLRKIGALNFSDL